MTALPNAMVPLVDSDGRPGNVLMALVPSLSAADQVVDGQGVPTSLFRARLQAMGAALPNPAVPLVNSGGTPTRVLTALLMRLA